MYRVINPSSVSEVVISDESEDEQTRIWEERMLPKCNRNSTFANLQHLMKKLHCDTTAP